MEKQRDKAAKRLQRKQGEKTPEQEDSAEEPENWSAEGSAEQSSPEQSSAEQSSPQQPPQEQSSVSD
jgi:hypothetical protein